MLGILSLSPLSNCRGILVILTPLEPSRLISLLLRLILSLILYSIDFQTVFLSLSVLNIDRSEFNKVCLFLALSGFSTFLNYFFSEFYFHPLIPRFKAAEGDYVTFIIDTLTSTHIDDTELRVLY